MLAKERDSTKEARDRSGAAYGSTGSRRSRSGGAARGLMRAVTCGAQELNQRLQISTSRWGKGKGKSKGVPGASESDQLYLTHLWNGNLLRAKNEAESGCHKMEAEPFRVDDDA